VWSAVERHRTFLDDGDRLVAARANRLALEVASLTTERLRARVSEALAADGALREDLAERRLDPYRAATMLLERVGAARGGGEEPG
jgi:putative protein kinase ArgK-like GTPase of G3E family